MYCAASRDLCPSVNPCLPVRSGGLDLPPRSLPARSNRLGFCPRSSVCVPPAIRVAHLIILVPNTKTGTKGINYVFVIAHNKIECIPADQTVTYTRIVVDFRPQKEDKNSIQMTAGGEYNQTPR